MDAGLLAPNRRVCVALLQHSGSPASASASASASACADCWPLWLHAAAGCALAVAAAACAGCRCCAGMHRWRPHHDSPLSRCWCPLLPSRMPQGRVYALPDVWIRPAFGGKGRKVTGTLEAHANGFRYSSPKGEELDIMYRCVLRSALCLRAGWCGLGGSSSSERHRGQRWLGWGCGNLLSRLPLVAAWVQVLSSNPANLSSHARCNPRPVQQHQARLLPARGQRDDCAGALPPGQPNHGGQEEDQRRAILHRGHGLGADAGRGPALHVSRGGPGLGQAGGRRKAARAVQLCCKCMVGSLRLDSFSCRSLSLLLPRPDFHPCRGLFSCLLRPDLIPAMHAGTIPTRLRRSSASASAATRSTASSTSL